jgi:hypothetical protein
MIGEDSVRVPARAALWTMSIPSNLTSLQTLLAAGRPTSVALLFASRRSSAAQPPVAVDAQRRLRPGGRVEDEVVVHISHAARQASSRQAGAAERNTRPDSGPDVTYATSNPGQAASRAERELTDTAPGAEGTPARQEGTRSAPGSAVPRQTETDQHQIRELEIRDREVRQHEAAHKNALGQYAKGGPTFSFTTGPDGQRYAAGGEVSVDLSEVPGNPDATIRKMTTIRRASQAPQDPSAADRAVAAEAGRILARARQEAQAEHTQEGEGQNGTGGRTAQSIDPRFRVGQQPLSDPYHLRGQLLDIAG